MPPPSAIPTPTIDPASTLARAAELLPRADAVILSHGRSGSTLLSDLMTTPADPAQGKAGRGRAVIVEPGLGAGVLGWHVREQLRRLDLPTGDEDNSEAWQPAAEDRCPVRAAELIAAAVAPLGRWGVKEVNPAWIGPTVAVCRPRRLVLLVRRLADATASLYRKAERDHGGPPDGTAIAWMIDRFTGALAAMDREAAAFDAGSARWVAYEDLVASPEARADLAAWLDWPLDGEPCARLDLYQRSHEAEHHAGGITTRSVNNYTLGNDAELDAFVDRMLDACRALPLSRPDLLGL